MSVPSFDHNTPEEVAAGIKAELARNFSRLPTEELARLGQLYNAADEMLTLNLPHAVLIIDPQDPDRHFNLLGPFDTPLTRQSSPRTSCRCSITSRTSRC